MIIQIFFCADFKKLHEAHFNKMESIDSYVQRKTKQMDAYRNSVKELKVLELNGLWWLNLKKKKVEMLYLCVKLILVVVFPYNFLDAFRQN